MISVVTRPVAASQVRTDHPRYTVGRDDVEASERNPAPLARSDFLASIPPLSVDGDEASPNASTRYGTIRRRTTRATLSILAYTPRGISSGTAARQRTRPFAQSGGSLPSQRERFGNLAVVRSTPRPSQSTGSCLSATRQRQAAVEMVHVWTTRPGRTTTARKRSARSGLRISSPILAASRSIDHHRSVAEVRVADEQAGVAMRQLYRGVRASFGGVACRFRGARARFKPVTPCGASSSTRSEEEKV